METKDIAKLLENKYTEGIEKASLRIDETFAVIDKNMLFGLSVASIDDAKSEKDYFYDAISHTHFFKLDNIIKLKELLSEMNALKHKTDDMLFSMIRRKGLDPDNIFYLKVYLFEGIRIEQSRK